MERKKTTTRNSPSEVIKEKAVRRLISAPGGTGQSHGGPSPTSRTRLASDTQVTKTRLSPRPNSASQAPNDSPGPLKHSASYTILPDSSKRFSPTDLELPSRSSSRNSSQDPNSPRSSSAASEYSGLSARQSPFSPIGRKGMSGTGQPKTSTTKVGSSRHLSDSYAFLLDTASVTLNRNRRALSPRSLESEASLNAALLEAFNPTRASPGVGGSGARKTTVKSSTQLQGKIKSFLTAGANPDMRDERGRPLVMVALEGEGNPTLLKMLLEFGASPDLTVEQNEFDILTGDDPFSRDSTMSAPADRPLKDQTALQYASRRGLQHCVGLLLSVGADVNLGDLRGNTALMKACKAGHAPTVRTLLEHDASLRETNSAGQTALHLAVQRDHNTDCVRILIEHGADVEAEDGNRQTPLLVAAKEGRFDLVEMILTHATLDQLSTVDHRDPRTHRSALHHCAQAWRPVCVQMLLQRGADPNALDDNWRNPLFLALLGGQTGDLPRDDGAAGDSAARLRQDVILELLDAGAKIYTLDRNLWTTLHAAARSGVTDVMETVAMAGRDVMQAAQLIDDVTEVVEISDVVNIKSGGGLTALMLASYYGHAGTVYKLLTLGANPEMTDRFHATALVYALVAPERVEQRNGLYDTINLLFKYNCSGSLGVSLFEMLYGKQAKHSLALDIIDRGLFTHVKQLIEPAKLYTPLEIAFLCGKSHIFFKLIKFGCNPWDFDTDIMTSKANDVNNNGNANGGRNKNDNENCKNDINGNVNTSFSHKSPGLGGSTLGGDWLDKRTIEYLIDTVRERRHQVPMLTQLCRGPALKVILQRYQSLDSINSLSASRDVKRILMFLKTPGETGRGQGPRSYQPRAAGLRASLEGPGEDMDATLENVKKKTRQLPSVVAEKTPVSARLVRLATPAKGRLSEGAQSKGGPSIKSPSANQSHVGFSKYEEKKMKPRFSELSLMSRN